MITKINIIEQNTEWQAKNLQNIQDDTSTIGRLRLLMGRSSKSNNSKKYFKDDNNLELLRTDLSNNFQKVLDFLITQGSGRRSFYFSQTKMATIIGCDRVTIQRATAYFESKGLLIKYRKDTWSVCLFIMSNKIYRYARGFKHKFLSLAAFLKGLWNKPQAKNVTPLRIKDVINFNSNSHVQLSVNLSQRSNQSSTVGDHLTNLFKKITPKQKIDTVEWQDIGNGLVRNRKGVVKCIEDVL